MTPQSRARTRLDPAVRRQQIAEAAARVFADHEPGEVSFESVAEEAGVSRALVYSYFGDRGSLFAAAYTHELAVLDEAIDRALEPGGSNRQLLASAVDAYLDFASRHRKEWGLIVSASASRHPAVRKAVAARTEQIARPLGGTPSARLLVRGIIGMLEAAALQAFDDDEIDVPALGQIVTEVIWGGVSSLTGVGSQPEVDVPEP